MPPSQPLPFSNEFASANEYIDSLLTFATSSLLFQTFCGGVHILDFFTQEPNTYDEIIPPEWRSFFETTEIIDLLNLMMRDDLSSLPREIQNGKSQVPASFLEFIQDIRKHSLNRDFTPRKLKQEKLPRHVVVGMCEKKVHEVTNFANYVDSLAEDISKSGRGEITHFVDFGSGQNYLGRSLASPPYERRIVAVESKKRNISGAKGMDVLAKLAEREKVMRNKKLYKQLRESSMPEEKLSEKTKRRIAEAKGEDLEVVGSDADFRPKNELGSVYIGGEGKGRIQYVEHIVKDGDLSSVVDEIKKPLVEEASSSLHESLASLSLSQNSDSSEIQGSESKSPEPDMNLMAISIHSCGNLSHHGIRSLLLNPSVRAIAIVGCCYNLLTERLSPPTYKHPDLNLLPDRRSINARVLRESSTFDPHGFPMSNRIGTHNNHGISLNITARMMAVQAPQNWTPKDSDAFFTRHFYRALLQKVFLDRGVVARPNAANFFNELGTHKISPMGGNAEGTEPVIIGSLRKGCYVSFVAYVRGAMEKLMKSGSERGDVVREKMEGITDEEIGAYEERYGGRKKELSVMWSLMAFSAGVVESLIVVDRWLFLREHGDVVGECWVEAVFEYALSPRNLVVVGIKK